ncbi:hypothetical protein DICSQDRAFT_129458 [Dichomitus squalens LYAD-421 SS1]|uniref:MARVEL domain-containing protein n=1 Tax=Dichomitus squalens (strain LYAD-421) TaxID=732165 RepID=R7SNY2_DICSQ|nr:uncharacterized protein DICSQDRAFT_129458 [Dichomitus squalens LYAD-421 SS1]EJF57450.1 hypothetical protein DICSQDRAFT_129458 [Dichomitus squalens LYAD-421 SS1]
MATDALRMGALTGCLRLIALATITAIIAQAMGQLTLNLSPGVLTADLTYAQLGVASGVLTILSLPLILLYDMAQEKPYSATVILELVWMLLLVVLWIVAGVKTMGITGSMFKNCSSFTNATLQGLCGDAQTLVIFALLSAGILALYTAALTFVAVGSSSQGKPIWTHFSMPGAKRH